MFSNHQEFKKKPIKAWNQQIKYINKAINFF